MVLLSGSRRRPRPDPAAETRGVRRVCCWSWATISLMIHIFIAALLLAAVDAFSMQMAAIRRPQGSAAKPFEKKKVAVLGGGGYLGALTFGFLQRAASLYGTGIGNCRCIGATANTAVRLNGVLGKHFCLAQADESFIKLTDLSSVDMIASRLQGWDALVLGSDLFLQTRPVTGGTFERTPNDKTWEIYWDMPRGSFVGENESDDPDDVRASILNNVLAAAKQAGTIQHLVVVDSDRKGTMVPQLDACGIPYTCITCSAPLTNTPNYSFKDGVVGDLSVAKRVVDANEGAPSPADKESGGADPVCREDLAALCVQSLQSLPWHQSRQLTVSCKGAVQVPALSSSPPKRIDQQWCVNGIVLEEKLANIS